MEAGFFSDSFVENLNHLIHNMHPEYKKIRHESKVNSKADLPAAIADDASWREFGDIVNRDI
jgi:hypothetical protein